MPDENCVETMLFNYESTNRTEFRDGEIKPIVKTVYKEKPRCYRIRPPPLKDIHTLTDWKNANVPFNLIFKPKETVHTNPRDVQQHYEKLPDLGLEQAKKTRPRLVMTPAVSMDDIMSPETRKCLIDDIYTTTAQRSMREGIAADSKANVIAPFPGLPAPANPITLKKLKPPYVSPEWRMDSVFWDNRQLRAYCNPSREFFLARNPQCAACDVTAALETQRKFEKQMKTL